MVENIYNKKYGRITGSLEEFLETKFIRRCKEEKKKIDPETGKIYYVTGIRAYYIKQLVKEGIITEDEIENIIDYLKESDIKVNGKIYTYEGEFPTQSKKVLSTKLDLPPTLSPEEQTKLFKEYYKSKKDNKGGDKELKNKLIKANMRLARLIANRIDISKFPEEYGLTIKDIESFAYEGLIYTVESFDPNKYYKFSSYAYKCIYFHIINEIRRDYQLGVNPTKYYQIQNCRKVIEEEKGESIIKNPSLIMDIIDYYQKKYNLSKEQFKNEMIYFKYLLITTAAPLSEEELCSEIIHDYNLATDPTFEEALSNLNRESIINIINELKPKDRNIILKYYGFENDQYYTLKKIGEEQGVSKQTIGQRHEKILTKMRGSEKMKNLINQM